MLRLLVDFNDIHDGVVRGLREDSEGPREIRVGDRVVLHDEGEHECLGTVRKIERDLVSVDVDWSTWDRVRLHVVSGGWWAPRGQLIDRYATSPPDVARITSDTAIATTLRTGAGNTAGRLGRTQVPSTSE